MKKFICCILALGLVLLGGCGNLFEKITVEDVLCPYTVQTKMDGRLEIEIDTKALPGFDFDYSMFWGGFCQVESEKQEQSVVYTVTGLKEGLEEITIRGMKNADVPEYRFDLVLNVQVDPQGRVLTLQHHMLELTGNGAGGEDSAYPYRWETDEDGAVSLYFAMERAVRWSLEQEEYDAISRVELLYSQEECILQIVPQEAGVEMVVLHNAAENQRLPIEITVSDTLTVSFRVITESELETDANG